MNEELCILLIGEKIDPRQDIYDVLYDRAALLLASEGSRAK
jgi:hypothetical protein